MAGSPDELIGRVLEMAGLVDYQANAVVSRTILERETGTVTVFAFGAGQGLSEHTTPYDALVYLIEGIAQITIGGQANTVAAGQMIIMPADIPHALHAPQDCKMLLVMIRS
ncbi:MAG: cupin domain-containing protein [Armatimonadota bacterium]